MLIQKQKFQLQFWKPIEPFIHFDTFNHLLIQQSTWSIQTAWASVGASKLRVIVCFWAYDIRWMYVSDYQSIVERKSGAKMEVDKSNRKYTVQCTK